jgi:hypothetical protein
MVKDKWCRTNFICPAPFIIIAFICIFAAKRIFRIASKIILKNMFLRYIIYLIGLSCGVCVAACTAEPNTPEAFLKARFPNVIDEIHWDSSKNHEFGAFFSDSTTGIGHEVYFNKKGQFLKLYTYINVSDFPAAAAQAIQQKYPNSKLAVLSLVEMPKTQFYHVELTTDKDYLTLEIDKTGAFLNEKVVPLSEQELQNAEEEGVDEEE